MPQQPDFRLTMNGQEKDSIDKFVTDLIVQLKKRQTYMQIDMPCYDGVQELIESYRRSLFVLKMAENIGYPIISGGYER